jgi:hypothetical protein
MSNTDWGAGGSVQRNSDGGFRGAQGGIGAFHESDPGHDVWSLWGGGRFGAGEQSDGSQYWGIQGAARSGGSFENPAASGESGFWGGFQGPRVGFDAYATDGMASAGYTANMASFSAGYRQVGESSHDRGLCMGLGVGPLFEGIPGALGARAHYGDADGDSEPEYGVGVSLPLATGLGGSIDYVTETPIRDSLLMTPVFPLLGAAAGGMAVGAKMDQRYGLSDSLAGVEGTSGTRGAPGFYGDMSPFERNYAQMMGSLFGD